MKDKLKFIATVIGLLVIMSGGLWRVWSVEAQVRENSYWIDEERYDRLEERIAGLELDCGEEAKDCGEKKQKLYRRWMRQKEQLGKKLGLD